MGAPVWGVLAGLARGGKVLKDVYTASKPARTAAKAAFKKAMKTKGRADTDKLLSGSIEKIGTAIKNNPIKTTIGGGFIVNRISKRRGKAAQRKEDRR